MCPQRFPSSWHDDRRLSLGRVHGSGEGSTKQLRHRKGGGDRAHIEAACVVQECDVLGGGCSDVFTRVHAVMAFIAVAGETRGHHGSEAVLILVSGQGHPNPWTDSLTKIWDRVQTSRDRDGLAVIAAQGEFGLILIFVGCAVLRVTAALGERFPRSF